MHAELRPKLCAPHPGAVHIQSPCLNAVARGAGGFVERVKPSEWLFGFGVHVPVPVPMPALALALWALLGVTAMGLEYEFEYGEDSNCPRECKSPIEAVARRTPMRDKSAMSSTVGGAAEGTGTCGGAGWTLGLTGWTVGVFVLLLSVSSWGSW